MSYDITPHLRATSFVYSARALSAPQLDDLNSLVKLCYVCFGAYCFYIQTTDRLVK